MLAGLWPQSGIDCSSGTSKETFYNANLHIVKPLFVSSTAVVNCGGGDLGDSPKSLKDPPEPPHTIVHSNRRSIELLCNGSLDCKTPLLGRRLQAIGGMGCKIGEGDLPLIQRPPQSTHPHRPLAEPFYDAFNKSASCRSRGGSCRENAVQHFGSNQLPNPFHTLLLQQRERQTIDTIFFFLGGMVRGSSSTRRILVVA